jgi:hypothetical protein
MVKVKARTFIVVILFFILIVFTFIYYVSYNKRIHQYVINRQKNPTLENTGYICYKNVFSHKEVDILLNQCKNSNYSKVKTDLLYSNKLNNLISSKLDQDYVLQDYIWIIQKSMVHTCHRDNNGDFFNKGQKYPSYTMIIYLEDMGKCLSVLPVSHKHENSYFFNFTTPLTNIICERGDVVLFNANLIHVGAFSDRDDNVRIQMKVSHKDDIPVLSYYQNFNKVLKQENVLPEFVRKAQRSISCTFPGISNLTQSDNIKSSRGTSDGAEISFGQRVFSYLFYGNSNFYDLPNAF